MALLPLSAAAPPPRHPLPLPPPPAGLRALQGRQELETLIRSVQKVSESLCVPPAWGLPPSLLHLLLLFAMCVCVCVRAL